VPNKYINDSIVMSYIFGNKDKGHRYAIQMTTAVTQDGGLSSSTLDEAKSWGKVKVDASRAMAWVEPTVALPLLVTAALQDGLGKRRARLALSWNGELLERMTQRSPR
jgi:deoxyhypusine synthase